MEETDLKDTEKYLYSELKEIVEGNATFYSIEEVEDRLDKIIKKHEDRL